MADVKVKIQKQEIKAVVKQYNITAKITSGIVYTGQNLYQLWLQAGNTGTLDDFLAEMSAGGNSLLSGYGTPTSGIGDNGDFYLNLDNNWLYGPKTSNTRSTFIALNRILPGNGVTGDTLVKTGSQDGDYEWVKSRHIHEQNAPLNIRTITHNMRCYPNIRCFDNLGTELEGSIQYVDVNTLTITFTQYVTGLAYLS